MKVLQSAILLSCSLMSLGADVYGDVSECAIRLLGWELGQSEPAVVGTATFAAVGDRRIIVTSYHVVRDKQRLSLAYDDKDGFKRLGEFVEDAFICDPSTDLAVFFCTDSGVNELTGQRYRRRAITLGSTAPNGTVLVVGNPCHRLFENTRLCFEYWPLNKVAEGRLSDHGRLKDKLGDIATGGAEDTNVLMLDSFSVTFGYSGGPIVHESPVEGPKLVGILQGGDSVKGLLAWGIQASHISEIVGKQPNVSLSAPQWPEPLFTARAYANEVFGLEMLFPITFPQDGVQRDAVNTGKGWMESQVTLSASGNLAGITHLGTMSRDERFRGEAIVLLADAGGNMLWHTQNRHRWEVPMGKELVRRDCVWDERVPEDVLPMVRRIRIVQRRSPLDGDDVLADVVKSLTDRGQRIDVSKAFPIELYQPALAVAQAGAKGEWKSTNDKPDSVKIDPPTNRIAESTKSFAVGEAEAVLGRGGPGGVFLWSHLHAVHPDRSGSSTYKLTVVVRDEGGYPYIVTPVLESKVIGVLDKPDRHRHSFGVFRLPPGQDANALKEAVDNGVRLVVEINGTRENHGFFGDIPDQAKELLGKYLEGQLDQIDLLKELRRGKTPRSP